MRLMICDVCGQAMAKDEEGGVMYVEFGMWRMKDLDTTEAIETFELCTVACLRSLLEKVKSKERPGTGH